MLKLILSYVCVYAVSGVVEEVDDVLASQSGIKRGDSVMALVGGGGYAGKPD